MFHGENIALLILILALHITARAKICKQIIPTEHPMNQIVWKAVTVWKRKDNSRLSGQDHEYTITILTEAHQLWRSSSLFPFPPEHKPVLCSHNCTDLAKPKHDILDEAEPSGCHRATDSTTASIRVEWLVLLNLDSGKVGQFPRYFGSLAGGRDSEEKHQICGISDVGVKEKKPLWVVTIGSALPQYLYCKIIDRINRTLRWCSKMKIWFLPLDISGTFHELFDRGQLQQSKKKI